MRMSGEVVGCGHQWMINLEQEFKSLREIPTWTTLDSKHLHYGLPFVVIYCIHSPKRGFHSLPDLPGGCSMVDQREEVIPRRVL